MAVICARNFLGEIDETDFASDCCREAAASTRNIGTSRPRSEAAVNQRTKKTFCAAHSKGKDKVYR
jgi:hypothetical protein